jgi:hypothetical protein
MGWERRGQHVSKLVLHAKQVYLMAQGLNPSSSTPSDTFLTNPKVTQPNPRPGGLEGGSNHAAIILLLIMHHLCTRKGNYLAHFSVSAPLSHKIQP